MDDWMRLPLAVLLWTFCIMGVVVALAVAVAVIATVRDERKNRQ